MPASFLNDCVMDAQIYKSEENDLFSLNRKKKKGLCEFFDFIYIRTYIHSWKISIISNLIWSRIFLSFFTFSMT